MQNRYDFVYLFDVKDGNPNGDPDAGNLPRVDAETGHGLVTDVALKRKVRNYVYLTEDDKEPYRIYVKEKAILNLTQAEAYRAVNAEDQLEQDKKGHWKSKGKGANEEARRWLCQNFFDIRAFGAVMSTGVNCGQVRGPVQMTFGRSVEPIIASEHAITRMAVTTEAEAEKQEGDNRTMGRKFTVPYGLYRAHGFVSAPLAEQTGFSDEDLELLWRALEQMFEHDHSAARGEMNARTLLVFRHEDRLGNAPAHTLFDQVNIERVNPETPARAFSDYRILFSGRPLDEVVQVGDTTEPGNGVTLIRRI
ncbi:MAG TPA: type I-C CRISPR-associated protein Cas7/Csd2 [Gammaproteobacteria bacterium]|nr:type I-C CRISPR-associated protein Cas7/Csd2 [Gammaproteobacteria bacterium]